MPSGAVIWEADPILVCLLSSPAVVRTAAFAEAAAAAPMREEGLFLATPSAFPAAIRCALTVRAEPLDSPQCSVP
jgi:hypothetical protein